MIGLILSWLGGGPLTKILNSIDNAVDNETQREGLRAKVIENYMLSEAETRRSAMQHRAFWYVWLMFAMPLGIWWALVVLDTSFTFVSWGIPDLPSSIQTKADTIFGSIFGSGAVVGVAQGLGAAIRNRK